MQMGERDTKTTRTEAIGATAASFPSTREMPDRLALTTIAILWLACGVAQAAPAPRPSPSGAPVWGHVITVDKRHPADSILEILQHQIAATGAGDDVAAIVLEHVGAFIASEVAKHGTAELSIGMLVDSVSAAQAARWSAQDTSRLVVALQREFDRERPEREPRLERAVARVRAGASPEQLLGRGDTLRTPTR